MAVLICENRRHWISMASNRRLHSVCPSPNSAATILSSSVHYQLCSFLIHGYGRKESIASTSPKRPPGLTQMEVLGLKEPPLPRGFDFVSAPTRDWGSIWRPCVSTACRKARWWRCRAGWLGHSPCHGRWLPRWPWSPRPDTPEGRRSPSAKQNKPNCNIFLAELC